MFKLQNIIIARPPDLLRDAWGWIAGICGCFHNYLRTWTVHKLSERSLFENKPIRMQHSDLKYYIF